MNRAFPQVRKLAKQLIGFETQKVTSADATAQAEFGVIDKLCQHLTKLMGRSGLQALLARSLVRATAEIPWLSALRVAADGELEGLAAARAACTAADFSEGEVMLLAQLLGLLVAFIGPALTLRLLLEVWPQLAFHDVDFDTTPRHEDST